MAKPLQVPWMAWMRLVRVPNTLTAATDVLAGAAIATGGWTPIPHLILLVLASICLYWSGMAWNDVIDVEEDRQYDRQRPIIQGHISLDAARRAAWALSGLGLLAAGLCSLLAFQSHHRDWPLSFIVALSLVALIRLYNSMWKETWIGPILMGLCRGLNVLLGISLVASQSNAMPPWTHRVEIWSLLLGQTLYILGVTLAARCEATLSNRASLIRGWLIALIGLACMAAGPFLKHAFHPQGVQPHWWYPLLIGLLAVPLVRRAIFAIRSLHPFSVQASIKNAILSIILFDAATVSLYAGVGEGMFCCLLILPSMWIGTRFRST